jgi:hypothetical protein
MSSRSRSGTEGLLLRYLDENQEIWSNRQRVEAIATRDAEDFYRFMPLTSGSAPPAGRLQLAAGVPGERVPSAAAMRTLLRRAVAPGQVEGGVDERHVRERLRKIAELAAGARVVFFGQ